MPAVSVIIPVYNAEDTIEKCVESLVLGQLQDIEVILIDDASRDGSLQLCQRLEQEYTQVICMHNEENRGVSYTRNRGLEVAAGEYIGFVDSDDWVDERYLSCLLEAARDMPDALPVCGLHYLNQVQDFHRIYLWKKDVPWQIVQRDELFLLHRKFLLPQLWNKLFRRDMIQKHGLRFDEEQRMGEDFQFVLEYLERTGVSTFLVINKPLYYYNRTGNESLMNAFGRIQREKEFARYEKLRDLTGNQLQYEKAVWNLKGSYIYHCLRYSKLPKKEQLEEIRQITGDDRAEEHYRNLQIVKSKELVVLTLRGIKANLEQCWKKYCRIREQKTVQKAAATLGQMEDPVTILAQDRMGEFFYQDMGMVPASPTTGLYVTGPEFVRLVSNLDEYLACSLQMYWSEEHPVGVLKDIHIRFTGYDTCRQAKEAWQHGCHCICKERILVLCTDRDGFTEEIFAQWKNIRYPKLLFTANAAYRKHPDSVYFREFSKQKAVEDLVSGRKFYREGRLVRHIKGMR